MATALIIADLEGVAGVDVVSALVVGGAGYEEARRLLTEEVNAAVRGLLEGGWDRVRVSDSHHSGALHPNILAEDLPPEAELCWLDDAYAAELFEGVEGVACIGMHAAAGEPGFAAHTVALHCDWWDGGERLSESDIVLGLAAEHGVPALFISGDDVLCGSLAGRVATVETKRGLSLIKARSRDPAEVREELRRTARAAQHFPVAPRGRGPLELRFKSAWQARLGSGTADARPAPRSLAVADSSFRERYRRGSELTGLCIGPLIAALRGRPADPEFLADIESLMGRSPDPAPGLVTVDLDGPICRARDAFLRWSADPGEFSVALRALVLQCVACHAPARFRALGLDLERKRAFEALRAIPLDFSPGIAPHIAMSRLDAWYLLRERGMEGPVPDPQQLSACLLRMQQEGDGLYAWLLSEMAVSQGLDLPVPVPMPGQRPGARLERLYVLTHRLLLDSRFLSRPLPESGLETETEALLLAVPWVVAQGHVDLAAEMAFCLQLAGELDCREHGQLLQRVIAAQAEDGTIVDTSMGDPPEVWADHATGVALVALAGAAERLRT